MTTSYDWIDTAGGPFLLIEEDLLPSWRGTEGWTFETHGDDDSDYSRACEVQDWVAPITCGTGLAYVLGGDVGALTWIETQGFDGGFLVQWLGIDDEAEILPALRSPQMTELLASDKAEKCTITVKEPGALRLLQAAEIGDNIVAPTLSLRLQAGTYRVSSACSETETLIIIVRRLMRQELSMHPDP
ncbi:hypothetical protein J7443_22040 [Tropicibacter sp. R15_0]|uniref:Imm21 family immunity protein n=1 Tax=Tropicibacter sp. R15_0 TaxID=2821101 RepID=UPI001AD9A5D7|nr:Imm21 family immunity protein [Tropicibacter sp. R15_0]MBO9467928.1 hypothetical protein [Tropicibacter sp. R15_0]